MFKAVYSILNDSSHRVPNGDILAPSVESEILMQALLFIICVSISVMMLKAIWMFVRRLDDMLSHS